MCGRFTLTQSAAIIAEAFGLEDEDLPVLSPRYNIAPTQPVAAIRADQGDRQFTHLSWGLVPAWAKDPKIGTKLINARAETLAEKPSFRAALKYRRCLIPADGFYEWQRLQAKKQPYLIGMGDSPSNRQPFAFAGLWEHWQSPDGSEIESCTIVTTEANALMRPIHDRMPVILPPQDYDRWLDPSIQRADQLQPLLRPYSAEAMLAYPVSSMVNNPRHDDPDCIEPSELAPVPAQNSPQDSLQNSLQNSQ